MNDAERQYAAQQAAYARSQVMASPAAYMSPVTTQSPGIFEAGKAGGTAMKASLSIDVMEAGTPTAAATPVSAISASSKRKTSGKKVPAGTGGKKKGGKGIQEKGEKADKGEMGFTIPSTPTQIGGQGGELQYGQTQAHDYPGSAIMSRAGTSDSMHQTPGSQSHQINTPSQSIQQTSQLIPQHPPQPDDMDNVTMLHAEQNGITTTTDGDDDMFKMFTGGDYADITDGLPQSANGGLNFDDFDVSDKLSRSWVRANDSGIISERAKQSF